jgi:MFS family permease
VSITSKYYLITALSNAYFPLGIWVIYFVERWSFSYTQVSLIIGTTLLTATLLDLVGGIHADVFGRKKSALVGYTLKLLSIGSFAFIDNFFILLGFAVIGGIGEAFVSGSLDALVADEVGAESEVYKQVNGRVQMYLFLARAGASVVGGYLYLQSLWLPFVAYGVCVCGALLLTSTLKDAHIKKNTEQFIILWKELWAIVATKVNVLFFCVSLLCGTLAGDLLWIYYQPFFSSIGFSGYHLGILFAGVSLFSALGSWILSSYYMVFTPYRVFTMKACAMVLNAFLLWWGSAPPALLGVIVMAITSGMFAPASRTYIAGISNPSNRTTMFSLGSSMSSIATFLGFILGGVFLDHWSHVTLLLTATIFAFLCFVTIRVVYARSSSR